MASTGNLPAVITRRATLRTLIGFESLSHFKAAFRSLLGVAPSVNAKRGAGRAL